MENIVTYSISGRSGYNAASQKGVRSMAGLEPYVPTDSKPWDRRRAAHLLRRAQIGPPSRAVIDYFVSLSPVEAVNRLFEFEAAPIPPSWVNEPITIPPNQDIEKERRKEFLKWSFDLALNDRTFREKMVCFWGNHFVVEIDKVKSLQLMYKINSLFRQFSIGNIRELAKAVGKDPAMLIYLDGTKNTNQKLNENYGRELQELFTIGIGNYTQQDVVEAARAYTGWKVNNNTLSSYLNPRFFDNGVKTFYGVTGNLGADDIVDIIFQRRETALFICRKIYRSLVYHEADESIVSGLADNLIANDYNIEPVLKMLFQSEHFMDDIFIGADIKSPMDFIIGIAKSFMLESPDQTMVRNALYQLGQPMFDPPNVAGWKEHRDWINTSTLSLRNGVVKSMVGNSKNPLQIDFKRFIFSYPDPNNPSRLVDDMLSDLLPFSISTETREALLKVLLGNKQPNDWNPDTDWAVNQTQKLLSLIMQMPEYQSK
ncbi:MAG: DUF1800 domain-containing protein [Nitrospirae bacterium]|nr:DUF1800 domain-containing protein [Nitrospirota bacterium]